MEKFVELDTIIGDVIDWGDYKGMIDRSSMKKWGNALVRKLEVPTNHINKMVLLDLKDFKVNLPEDLEAIVQVAFKEDSTQKVKRVEIVEWTQQLYDGSGCELVISKDCPKCHNDKEEDCGPCTCDSPEIIYDVDRLWELSHPEFKYNHMKHYYRHGGLTNENQVISPHHKEFRLMKHTKNVFFNADSHIPGCLNLNTRLLANCNIEYNLNNSIMEVNCETGKVLLVYLAARVGKDGYRMIPDIEDVFEAIKWYIIEAMHFREINKASTIADKNHHKQMWALAKNEKIEAMGRSIEILNTPSYTDWMCFLDQNYMRMFREQSSHELFGGCVPDVYNDQMTRLTGHS